MKLPREVNTSAFGHETGEVHVIAGAKDVDRAVRALHHALRALEGIASHQEHSPRGRAREVLYDLGVWQRTDRKPAPPGDGEGPTVAIATAASLQEPCEECGAEPGERCVRRYGNRVHEKRGLPAGAQGVRAA